MEAVSVGIREFRTDMAQYISARSPVAITRHSQTVGYFIPKLSPTKHDFKAVKAASAELNKLLEDDGIDIEELVAAFKASRLVDRKSTPAITPALIHLAAPIRRRTRQLAAA